MITSLEQAVLDLRREKAYYYHEYLYYKELLKYASFAAISFALIDIFFIVAFVITI